VRIVGLHDGDVNLSAAIRCYFLRRRSYAAACPRPARENSRGGHHRKTMTHGRQLCRSCGAVVESKAIPGDVCRPRELQFVLVDAAEAEEQKVLHVVLVEAPRNAWALAGDARERAPHVAGLEVDERYGLHRCIVNARCHDVVATSAHVIEQTAYVLGDEIALE